MSNNISDRISNTANSYIGGAKQTVGETIGNNSLAASGAEQRAGAEARQAAADAKTHAEGAGHTAQGKVQQTVGSLTGNTSMEARGHANEVKGDLERKSRYPECLFW
ncbi:hypothetical protein BCR41DRAFT_401875 [Lobosporangium transversale]|uniref:Uncharacterized protein n=1 Tax=Lobosporangium transversale TaxID=64571 RepID=A0A1Y2G6P2_9FUNG|nr:hypothetical protein BCR41DRAFT_401875 [Lobosporangium transversale]ORY98380.1 hypothetical protein BCR41DRAFT_401875 [Lobosporangium transversale]|eukprot:XP_021875772.1 hypothetical protein BCR41DRAFT_401875 [Lobosporangium transversale]